MASDIILNDDDLEIIGEKVAFRRNERSTSKPTVVIDPKNGNLEIGRNGTDGDLLVFGKSGKRSIEISAEKNRPADDRTVYINGKDSLVELKGARKRASGVFPTLSITPTAIECKTDRGSPKFKITDKGTVFSTQVSFIVNSLITIARDITIRAKNRNGVQETVNVHKDIIALKAEVRTLKAQIENLRR